MNLRLDRHVTEEATENVGDVILHVVEEADAAWTNSACSSAETPA